VFSIRTLVATRFQDNNKALVSDIIRNRESNFLTTDYIF
jgi:glyceraldehyde-3-phosphate dehydrogenase (NADP+)